MDKTFLNYDKLYAALEEVFTEALENMEDGESYDWMIEGYCEYHTQRIMDDMKEYIHKKDTSMIGNFANIRTDWEYCKEFVKSNVEPWGRFDDIVASVDNGTITDEDLAKLQEWCLDWFFTAFGTWGLKYNFQTDVADQMYIDEQERERENEEQ